MSSITAEEAAQLPVISDEQVEARVASLVGRACRRQLWLMFLNSENVQLPVLVPVEDYPSGPGEGAAEQFAARVREILIAADAAQVIFVWERRLGEAATPADRSWAKALADACAAEHVAVRAQLISHRSGVRWFPSDEFA